MEGNRIQEQRSDLRHRIPETYLVISNHSHHQILKNTDIWISKKEEIITNKEGYCIMIKRSICPRGNNNPKCVYVPKNRAKYN